MLDVSRGICTDGGEVEVGWRLTLMIVVGG